jgi:hypothetical protein
MTTLAVAPARRIAPVIPLPVRTAERTYTPCDCGDPAGVLRHAREDTRASCRAWGFSADYGEDAAFAVHELVANSFRYGTPPAAVRLTAGPSGVTIRVRDKGTFAPVQTAPGEEYRHGLGIIRTLACGDLTISCGTGGTTVTVTIPVARAEASA